MVRCQVCQQEMDVVSWKHLASHQLTTQQYKQMFPTARIRSVEADQRKRESATRANAQRKGIPRDQTTRQRISTTKRNNPTVAWNKGIPLTDAAKQHLSQVKKQRYQTGDIVHWNTGNTTPDHVKQKISATSKQQHRTYSEESKRLRRLTLQQKQLDGWVRKQTYEITPEHYNAWRAGTIHSNQRRTAEAIERARDICDRHQVTIVNVSHKSYSYTLQCNVCSTTFERTRNAFIDSKVDHEAFKCPSCHPRSTIQSAAELEVIEFIRANIPEHVSCIQSDRTVLNGREIDCYLPELNLGFEYNGLYWHAERVSGKPPHVHNWKTKLASTKGVRLITIFEDEWLRKPNVVKSRILHLVRGKSQRIVYARKTQIREISNLVKDEFLEQHHIQGKDVSGIRYGAWFGDELVAVMTFSKTNMSKGGDGKAYELNRFAVLSNTHVPGIASKLFKHFIRSFTPDTVISYADRRWCTGKVYDELGFVFDSVTPPSYWYLTDGYTRRAHRSNFMKHMLCRKLPLYDPAKTEWENMCVNGYDRIWDCGTNKFIYNAQV